MGVGAGLYMYVMHDVVVKLFTFPISSPDEFLYKRLPKNRRWLSTAPRTERLFAARKSGQRTVRHRLPQESSSLGSRAFAVAIPKVWNQPPASVRHIWTVLWVVNFKCHLKTTAQWYTVPDVRSSVHTRYMTVVPGIFLHPLRGLTPPTFLRRSPHQFDLVTPPPWGQVLDRCTKYGNSAWNLVIWFSGKSFNLLPPDVRF